MNGINVKKLFGKQWKKLDNGLYQLSLNYLISNVEKNFGFYLYIPKINKKVTDFERTQDIIELVYVATTIDKKVLTES